MFVLLVATMVGISIDQAGQDGPPPAGMFAIIMDGLALMLATAIWFCIRCILSLVKAGDRKPIPKPETWLS